MENGLTSRDERRLKTLEDEIARSCGTLYQNMKAIHDEKLYRGKHKTWEDYCQERWNMTPQHANRLIHHGQVLRIVEENGKSEPIGSLLTEAHTRETIGLEPEVAAAVISEAVATATVENGKPKVTARHVKATRAKVEQREPGDESEPTGEAPIIRDELEREVPRHLRDKHAAAAQIKSAATKLDAAKKAIEEIRDSVGTEFLPVAEILVLLKDVKGKIAHARYWTDCPRCYAKRNAKCDRCDGHGYLPFSRRGMLSEDDKAFLGIEK